MFAPGWAQPMTREKAFLAPAARVMLSPGTAAAFTGSGATSGQFGVVRKVEVGSPAICCGGWTKPGGGAARAVHTALVPASEPSPSLALRAASVGGPASEDEAGAPSASPAC